MSQTGDLTTEEWARRIDRCGRDEVDVEVQTAKGTFRGEVEAVGYNSVKIGKQWIRRNEIIWVSN